MGGKVKPKSISELKAYRNEKIKQMKANGVANIKIAEKFKLSEGRVSQIINESLENNSLLKNPKDYIKYSFTMNNYTKPETAAIKIRDKFGDEFADQLKELL
jgi:DNA invertase Pin-like site-specific DNA recombinase